jgi:hypothetical protein
MPYVGGGGYNINKLPGNSKYKSAFLASMIVIGVVCVPKFIMESNKKQGHGYFDNEDVRKSRERYKYLTIQFILIYMIISCVKFL